MVTPAFTTDAVHLTVSKALPGVTVRPVGAFGRSVGVTLADGALAAESPTAERDFTVNVYAVPFVKPVHDALQPVTTHAPAAGEDVTMYVVIGLPPSLDGAVHETVADASPATALTAVGAPGRPGVVTAADAALEAELPTEFVATTVNVYDVPSARPVQVAPVSVTTHDAPAPDDVTVYPVIAVPPLLAGAVHVTFAERIPAVALTNVGGSGVVTGVTVPDAALAGESPALFVATTVNV